MNIQKIGKLIAACRKEKGMTQAQLAEKLGVTNKTVSQWENGNYMPDLTILEPLSHELGISLEELLSGERIILFCTTNLVFKNEKREKIILTSTHYNCSILLYYRSSAEDYKRGYARMKDKKIVTLITTIVFCLCLIEGVTAERTLTDISEGTWYTNAVKYCQGKGYVGGYPDGSFRPNQPVTRAEIATILCTHATVNGIKLPDTGAEFSAFKDANSGGLHEWNHEPVHWAVSRGIIAGYEDRTIRLNAYVTREQIAVMLSNYFDVQKKAGRTGYVDEKEIGAWALSSVKGMTDSKHMIGVGNRKFCPKHYVTRAQVCQIIMSFAEIIYEEGIPAHASSNCMLKCVTPGVWERTDVKLVVVKQKGNIESTGEPVINDRIEKVPSLGEENKIVADIEKEAQQYPVYREKLADPVKGMIATYDNWGELDEIYIPNGDGTYYIPERTYVKVS